MRKIFLLIIITLLFGVSSSYSNWYGSFTQTISGGFIWCNTDGDTTGGSPTFSNSPLPGTYTYDSRVISLNSTTITCERWDEANPSGSVSLSPSGWTNGNVTVTITCSDAGGSGCNMYNINGWTKSGNTYSRTFTSNTTGSIILKDLASNQTTVNYSITNIDKVAPLISNITGNGVNLNGTFFPADNNKNFDISVNSAGGSPIVSIKGQFEKSNEPTLEDLTSSSNANLSVTRNVSLIDHGVIPTDLNTKNYREFTFKVTEVKDAAGNIMSPLPRFTYYVYAANVNAAKSYLGGTVSDFNTKVADGTEKELKVYLRDAFDNQIRPVDDLLGNRIRDVTLGMNYNNDLYLNQLDETGRGVTFTNFNSSVHMDSILGNNNHFSSFSSVSETYPYSIKFKVYSPTSNSNGTNQTKAKGGFNINSFNSFVSDHGSTINVASSSINFNFKPIYYSTISGDLSPSGSGFVEGTTQTGTILITKNGTSDPTATGLYFVQSGSTLDYFTGTGEIDTDGEKLIESSTNSIGTKFLSTLSNSLSKIFTTLFTLKGGSGAFVDDVKDLRLYQYIRYTIDPAGSNKTVTYLAGILNETNTNNFETLKIYGITNIDKDKQRDLIENQDSEDIQNLAGEIVKSSLKRDLRKNAINATKLVTTGWNNLNTAVINSLLGPVWDTNNNGTNLGNILYFDQLDGKNVELGNGIDLSVTGKKTIVIKGGNLYIKSNIINNSIYDVLGIIVLQDENGKGGKVYIDTSVAEIDAIIYTDKSIISYNTSYDNGDSDSILKHEVDGNINNSVMQNQLYIYGTVFSENTIGGSRLDPPICPFYTKSITGFVCDLIEAQKYDFNYLRAGFDNKYDDSYADYPVIIKYNSTVQYTSPPLFDK